MQNLSGNAMRLAIVQYAGDFREAYFRLACGGAQTYQAQRYSVDLVGTFAQRVQQLTVICALTDEAYDEILPNGVRVIGGGFKQGFNLDRFKGLLDKANPTHLWVSTVAPSIFKWALKERVPAIAVLADSFNDRGIKAWLKKRQIALLLNRPGIKWVANHGISASLSLKIIGVKPAKIVPWDWPPSATPSDYAARELSTKRPFTVLYVGSISEAKGVADLVRAAAILKAQKAEVQFRIVGPDHHGAMQQRSAALKLTDTVDFVGPVANEKIIGEMRSADIVVIPSRHTYPEGMPLTIYEALSARTPIVASDHPMFRRVLIDGESAKIFKAADANDLALALTRLLGDGGTYHKLSVNSAIAWQRLQVPVSWGALLDAWIAQDQTHDQWIARHRLDSDIYEI